MPPLSHVITHISTLASDSVALPPAEPMTKRSVRFLDIVDVQVQSITDVLVESEKGLYWMHPQDYIDIKQDCINTIQNSFYPQIKSGREFRGLEHKTPMGAQRRSENRRRAKKTVLDEQAFQRKIGFIDPEYIATLYKTVTHRSRVEANTLGIRDEIAAKRCLSEDEDEGIISVYDIAERKFSDDNKRVYGQKIEV